MSHTFTKAIIRFPASNFADGLTTVDLGQPIFATALQQHAAYCATLRDCGLTLTELEADARYPDSTFVEDTAILTKDLAVLTHPGAPSREGEVRTIKAALDQFYTNFRVITALGNLDGGDICEAEQHFFIGLSQRTDEEGARQLTAYLEEIGCTAAWVDIRDTPGILHLKSGIAYVGDNNLVVIEALADHPAFEGYNLIRVAPGEEYAANCVRVNDHVLLPAGYPQLHNALTALGYHVIPLEMSEFQKMDGGLSCLSLRF